MTDNEIIKALECCIADNATRCGECAYCGTVGCCFKMMMPDALDLIKRKDAEIKKKDTEIDILIRKKEALKDEISELQRKNSDLEIELKAMRGAANSYKAEVERLKEIEFMYNDLCR